MNQKATLLLLSVLVFGCWGGSTVSGQTAAPASQQTITPARFAYGGNVTQVPVTFIGQRLFLPVTINGGQPSLFMLDSTARFSSIDPGRAAELDLKAEASPSGPDTPAGQIIANPTLGLLGVDVPMATLGVAGSADFNAIVGHAYEGTLGADFLARVVVEIDYGQQRVRLYDPNSFHDEGKGATVPVTFAGITPVIRAKYSELSGRSGEGDFLVETALDSAVVFSNRYADAHKLFSSHMASIQTAIPELDSGENIVLARLDGFQIGPFNAFGTLAAFSRTDQASGGDPKLAGIIGGGMLRRYVVVFDYPHKRMIFEPGSQFRTDDEEDKSGMTLIAKGPGLKQFEVTQVQPDTPAAKAGIQKGDIVAGIDDEPAADMTLDAVRNLFCEPVRKYNVLMERNGNTYEAMLQMRRRI
jgi:hypothetical protein